MTPDPTSNRFDLSCAGDLDRRIHVEVISGAWNIRLLHRAAGRMEYITPNLAATLEQIEFIEAALRGDVKPGDIPELVLGPVRISKGEYPLVSIELDGEPFGKVDGALFTAGIRKLMHGR